MVPFESIELRAHGFVRFVVSGFLAVWLCGWAAGEWFVLRTLWNVFFGEPGQPTGAESFPGASLPGAGVVVFLMIWSIFWTFGGFAAMVIALRLLVGRDIVELTPTGFAVRQLLGPFERVVEYHREDVSELRIKGTSGAIIARIRGKLANITNFGTSEEKSLVIEQIRAHGGVSPGPPKVTGFPKDWVETRANDGSVVFANKWIHSSSCLAGCGAVGIACLAVAVVPILFMGIEAGGAHVFWAVVGAVMLGLTLGLRTATDRWEMSEGRLDIVRTFGPWRRTTQIRNAVLYVRNSIDDDRDEHTTLIAITPGKEHHLTSRMDGEREIAGIARRVAEITGWDLMINPDVEPDE